MLMFDEFVPAELAETVDRLENWARWAIERTKHASAASAEGRYRPRRGNNETEEDALERARRGFTPQIDPWDAQLVGKCLAPAGGFPHRWYVLLKLRYFYRARRQIICRRMAVSRNNYPLELNKALYAARNALTKRNAWANNQRVTAATAKV